MVDRKLKSLATGLAAGSNPHNIGYLRAGRQIDSAVQQCLRSLAESTITLHSIYCGIAGIRDQAEQDSLRDALAPYPWTQNAVLTIHHDLSIAYEAALGSQPGICLIAGTGASCIGRTASGEFHRASNRQDDGEEPGSGYAIGLEGIRAGLVTTQSQDRDAIARLAETVIEAAHNGDVDARMILDTQSDVLVELITTVHAQAGLGESFHYAFAGALAQSDTLYGMLVAEKLRARFPQAQMEQALVSPVVAAARLAVQQC